MQKSGSVDLYYPTGTIILVESCLDIIDDVRMIFDECCRPVQALFFTSPMPYQNGSLRIWIKFFENTHRFHHDKGSGSIIGCSRRTVPLIEVSRKHDVLIRF